MVLNSFAYFIFLLVIAVLFFALKPKYRWLFLLAASYFFYATWSVQSILLILLSTTIAYFTAIGVERAGDAQGKKRYLLLGVVSNVGILFLFKYFNFFNQSLRALFAQAGFFYGIPDFHLLLPVGISYYTFQVVSYLADVYHGRIRAERHFGIFALYLVFFPKLIAGPIERAGSLIPQFYQVQRLSLRRAVEGVKLIVWGLFKKAVIADRLAIAVNAVYDNPQGYEGIALIVATVFFALQIYCDFSAYSDMAVGSGKVLGFELSQNFRQPYYAKSIREFWARWHISLSSWLRDYIYIPLGGNRVKTSRYCFNIMATFLVSGLWHGANWTFVLWGGLHGIYQIAGRYTQEVRERLAAMIGLTNVPRVHALIQMGITFGLVCFAWIFFRANSIADALYIASHLTAGLGNLSPGYVASQLTGLGLSKLELVGVVFSVALMEAVHAYQRSEKLQCRVWQKPFLVRWAFYYLIIFMIMVLGVYDSGSQFIYVQF